MAVEAAEAFEFLPVGAVIEDKILCLHGGARLKFFSALPTANYQDTGGDSNDQMIR